MSTPTGILRALLEEHHAPPEPDHDPDLVPAPRPPLRRPRRAMRLPLPRRTLAAALALPTLWTGSMIAAALAVRYG